MVGETQLVFRRGNWSALKRNNAGDHVESSFNNLYVISAVPRVAYWRV